MGTTPVPIFCTKKEVVYTMLMITRKSTFFLGIFIVILSSSFLGLPSAWKSALIFLSGLALIVLSVELSFPKKPIKKSHKKHKTQPIVLEPISPDSLSQTEIE